MLNKNKHQSGAALVIGLIMLLVMTLIGITSMSTTRTELKIANNLNNHSTAFQVASAMIELVLVNPDIVWDARDTPQTGIYTSADAKRTASSSMSYAGCRNVLGSSIVGSAGAGIVHKIEANGRAENSNGDVIGVSRQTSGYLTVVAGCG